MNYSDYLRQFYFIAFFFQEKKAKVNETPQIFIFQIINIKDNDDVNYK